MSAHARGVNVADVPLILWIVLCVLGGAWLIAMGVAIRILRRLRRLPVLADDLRCIDKDLGKNEVAVDKLSKAVAQMQRSLAKTNPAMPVVRPDVPRLTGRHNHPPLPY